MSGGAGAPLTWRLGRRLGPLSPPASPGCGHCSALPVPCMFMTLRLHVAEGHLASSAGLGFQSQRPALAPATMHLSPGSWLVNVASFCFGGSLLPHKGDNGPEA